MPFWEIIIIIQLWSEWPGRLCEAGGVVGLGVHQGLWQGRVKVVRRPLLPSHRLLPSRRKQFHVYNSTFLSCSHWLYELRLSGVSCSPPAGNGEVDWGVYHSQQNVWVNTSAAFVLWGSLNFCAKMFALCEGKTQSSEGAMSAGAFWCLDMLLWGGRGRAWPLQHLQSVWMRRSEDRKRAPLRCWQRGTRGWDCTCSGPAPSQQGPAVVSAFSWHLWWGPGPAPPPVLTTPRLHSREKDRKRWRLHLPRARGGLCGPPGERGCAGPTQLRRGGLTVVERSVGHHTSHASWSGSLCSEQTNDHSTQNGGGGLGRALVWIRCTQRICLCSLVSQLHHIALVSCIIPVPPVLCRPPWSSCSTCWGWKALMLEFSYRATVWICCIRNLLSQKKLHIRSSGRKALEGPQLWLLKQVVLIFKTYSFSCKISRYIHINAVNKEKWGQFWIFNELSWSV